MKNIGINLIFKKIKIFNKVDFVKACLYMFENYSSIEKNGYNILNRIEEINKLKHDLLIYKLNYKEKNYNII